MLCAFPSRHFRDVLIDKLKFSCFISYGFLFPPEPLIRMHSDSFPFKFFAYTTMASSAHLPTPNPVGRGPI